MITNRQLLLFMKRHYACKLEALSAILVSRRSKLLTNNKGLGKIRSRPVLFFAAKLFLLPPYSVVTLSFLFSAACIVCHERLAHLTRAGKSRTPAKIVR